MNPSPKTRVLIVEDEAPVALNLQERLEDLGYEIPGVAVSGEEAVSLAAELRPDIVLMDVRLKGTLDGIEAAAEIRSRHHLPVVYLTAFTDESTLRRAQKTEPFGYLLKPFRERELHTCVEMALYKHRAEVQLRESEQRYAATLQSIGDGLIAVEPGSRITLLNPVAESLTGWPRAEAVGRPVDEVFRIVHEETEEPVPSPVGQALRQGVPVALANHTLLLARDGRRIPIEDTAAPIRVPGRETSGAVLVFRDVSERRQAAAALRQKAGEIEDLYNNAPCGYHSLDETGTVVRINDTELGWLGRTRAEVLNRVKFSEFLAPSSQKPFQESFARLKEHGSVRDVEIELARADGSTFPVLLNATAVTDERGLYLMSRSTLHDLGERRRAEEERRKLEARMLQAQKLESLGLLAGGVAHDFNNLLTAILGYADLELLNPACPPEIRESLHHIVTGAHRAADLTRQMLAYSGKGALEFHLLDLRLIVKELTELLIISMSKKVTLRVDVAPDLPLIQGEPGQLRQVVMNLILNAAEAIGEQHGTITLCLEALHSQRPLLASDNLTGDLPEGRCVSLTVTDTGCGMSADTLTRIFDPFFTTKFTGRGLGLAAVLGIVRSHRGALEVSSELGQGSTFTVLLPVSEALPQPAAVPTSSWSGSGMILVVDDETEVRNLARRMLETMGFEVQTAADGQAGVEMYLANADRIRLVLLDLTMPGLDGVETYYELRRLSSNVHVVVCSGFGEMEAKARLPSQPGVAFLAKPFRFEELASVVRRRLETPPSTSQPDA